MSTSSWLRNSEILFNLQEYVTKYIYEVVLIWKLTVVSEKTSKFMCYNLQCTSTSVQFTGYVQLYCCMSCWPTCSCKIMIWKKEYANFKLNKHYIPFYRTIVKNVMCRCNVNWHKFKKHYLIYFLMIKTGTCSHLCLWCDVTW